MSVADIGAVTSAGIIRVRDGLVTELQPLSGHYRSAVHPSVTTGLSELRVRASIDHFRQFLDEMDRRGLDLKRVHLTKGEIMLWGFVLDNCALDC